jgi:FixJ family two-component response regulator
VRRTGFSREEAWIVGATLTANRAAGNWHEFRGLCRLPGASALIDLIGFCTCLHVTGKSISNRGTGPKGTFQMTSQMTSTMTSETACVYIVDDDPLLRESLSSLLRSIGWRVELFASVADFLTFKRPDVTSCLVLDVRLQGISGLDFQNELVKSRETLPIVFMTGYGDIAMTVKAMKAGAVDFLAKPFREQDLLDAVSLALRKDAEQRETSKGHTELINHFRTLSARERQVMALAASGLMNKQIASEVCLSEITVKIHRANVMRKMNAKTFAELVRMSEALKLRLDTQPS